jgi:amidohydrolase
MRSIEPLIDAALPQLIELRHDLHSHPELSYNEYRTAGRVLEKLQALPGLDIRTGVAETGIVATLGAEKKGPCVALRADMDALPIEEQTGAAYASQEKGKMHACGHDGHTTCLVGAAQILHGLADELQGPVKFVFQPAEEGGAGAKRMCEEGVLKDPEVSAIFGLHGFPDLPQGVIGLSPGPVLASADTFAVTVHGAGAHAAYPHQGVDPVLAAAHIVVALQSIVARRVDPLDSAVITVSQLQAGSADNIIPPSAHLSGTIRAFRPETRQLLHDEIRRVAVGSAEGLGCRAEVEISDGYPPLINEERARATVARITAEALGEKVNLFEAPPVMGAEDFAFYTEYVPAAFFAMGLCPAGRDSYPKLHQPDFDFPDAALPLGVTMHVEIARRFASVWPAS